MYKTHAIIVSVIKLNIKVGWLLAELWTLTCHFACAKIAKTAKKNSQFSGQAKVRLHQKYCMMKKLFLLSKNLIVWRFIYQ